MLCAAPLHSLNLMPPTLYTTVKVPIIRAMMSVKLSTMSCAPHMPHTVRPVLSDTGASSAKLHAKVCKAQQHACT